MTRHALARLAGVDDVPYIDALRRRNSEQIGFLSTAAYEGIVTGQRWDGGRCNARLWLVEAEGDPVGFLYATPGAVGRAVRIIQVCVQEDARRLEYGQALVDQAEAWAVSLQRPAVGCHFATDIDARAFWDALGYEVRSLLPGGTRRGRILESRYKQTGSGLWVAA